MDVHLSTVRGGAFQDGGGGESPTGNMGKIQGVSEKQNRTKMQARRPNRNESLGPVPLTSSSPVSTYFVRIKIRTLALMDNSINQSTLTHTVGIWSKGSKRWLMDPLSCKPDNHEAISEMLRFVVPAGDLEDAEVVVKISRTKMMTTHEVGEASMGLPEIFSSTPIRHSYSQHQGDSAPDNEGLCKMALTLVKPASKSNPYNRGTLGLSFGVTPLTYAVQPGKLLDGLPHKVHHWVFAFTKPADTVPPPKQSGPPGMLVRTTSNLVRFRQLAMMMQEIDRANSNEVAFAFGEVPIAAAEGGRMGTKVAFGIEDTTSRGEGKLVGVVGHQKLTLSLGDAFEHPMTQWVKQFQNPSSASSVWKQAVEAMGQLNPCAIVDLFGDNSPDFEKISIMSRLIVEVSDVLSTGTKVERAGALKTLALDAPQALCLAAVNIRYDALLEELQDVIYEDDVGIAIPQSKDDIKNQQGAESFLRKRLDSNTAVSTPSSQGISPRPSPSSPGPLRTSWSPSPNTNRSSVPDAGKKGRLMRWFGSHLGSSTPMAAERTSWHGSREMPGDDDDSGLDFDDSSGSMARSATELLGQIPIDQTWHGTLVLPDDVQRMEISEVPRHGTLRPPGADKPMKPARNIRVVPGSMQALEVLGTVLGRDFLERIALPCVLAERNNQADTAQAIGKIYAASLSNGLSCTRLVERLREFLRSPRVDVRCPAVESIGVIARHHNDFHAQDLALLVARSEVHPQVLDRLVTCIPDLFEHAIRKRTNGAPESSTSGAGPHPLRLRRRRTSLHGGQGGGGGGGRRERVDDLFVQSSPEVVSLFCRCVISVVESHPDGAAMPEDVARRCSQAALALARFLGRDRFREVLDLFRFLLRTPSCSQLLCGDVHTLCRHLCPPGFSDVTQAGAPPDAHPLIESCLDMFLSVPDPVRESPSDRALTSLWAWRALSTQGPRMATFFCNLPLMLASLPRDKRRPEWLFAVQAMYHGFLVARGVLVDDAFWEYVEGGSDTCRVGGESLSISELTKTLQSATLAHYFPAAAAMMRDAGVDWFLSRICHQALSEDDDAKLRWTMARSLPEFPALFGFASARGLADQMLRLLHDADLDVAEAVHKSYLDFALAVIAKDPSLTDKVTRDFTDRGLWSRRLHFAIYQAEQLTMLLRIEGIPDVEEKCTALAIELLGAECTEVRKQAANASAEMVAMLPPALPCRETLLGALLACATGTCRQKQTYLWACEGMIHASQELFREHFFGPLKIITEMPPSVVRSRSLVYDYAWILLGRVNEGRIGIEGGRAQRSPSGSLRSPSGSFSSRTGSSGNANVVRRLSSIAGGSPFVSLGKPTVM